jgi:hypothetical protein
MLLKTAKVLTYFKVFALCHDMYSVFRVEDHPLSPNQRLACFNGRLLELKPVEKAAYFAWPLP